METGFPHHLLTGYVLAGGASSRMGQDKALMNVAGRTLVETAVLKLKEVCGDVAILCGGDPAPQRLAALRQVARTVPENGRYLGPVAGIAAALADARTSWVLVVAVDQPFLPAHLLQIWFAATVSSGAQASCITVGKNLQPIPVLMRSTAGPAVSERLRTGERRVRAVLEAIPASSEAPALHRYFVEETAEAKGWFRNLNYPADLLPTYVWQEEPLS